jgi:hypothetical protein
MVKTVLVIVQQVLHFSSCSENRSDIDLESDNYPVMKTKLFCLFSLTVGLTAFAQNIKFDHQRVAFYRYPLKPLDKSIKTYSASIQELNATLASDMRDSLKRALVIPGYEKLPAGGDIQIELIVSPLAITNKELKDQPLENDDKKTVIHQYWYEIKYAFPVKVRLVSKSQTIGELDLPGFFTTEYYTEDRSSQGSLQRAFDNDIYFVDKLKYKRVGELKDELRSMLASHYGYGMSTEFVDVGYIKDKKGEYADLAKAMSVMHEGVCP